MSKQYYILEDGRLSETLIFGTSYILVECGSSLTFDLLKLKKMLSKNISYSIDLSEGSIAEIHFGNFISLSPRDIPTKNHPSRFTLEEFLEFIK